MVKEISSFKFGVFTIKNIKRYTVPESEYQFRYIYEFNVYKGNNLIRKGEMLKSPNLKLLKANIYLKVL